MMRANGVLAAITMILAAAVGSAQAGLVGDTVTVTSDTSSSGEPTTANVVVGAGTELPNFGGGPDNAPSGFFNVDLGDFQIFVEVVRLVGFGGNGFQGLRFADFDFLPPGILTGVTVSSSRAGFDPSRVTFTGDSLNLDLGANVAFSDSSAIFGVGYAAGDTVTLDLTVAATPAAVPEPGSMVLLGLAGSVAGIGALRRRMRARVA